MIAREYHNQNKCQGVSNQNDCEGLPPLKGIPGSSTIKMTAREYNKIVLSVIITIETTAREHSNEQNCQEIPKLKGDMYFQGVSKQKDYQRVLQTYLKYCQMAQQ